MNLNTTGIIIGREYLTRVKKKSFLLTTFVVPVLFAVLCILPSVIMMGVREESKEIAVLDRSGIVAGQLQSGESANFTFLDGGDVETLKSSLKELGYDALLYVSPIDSLSRSVTADIYSVKPIGMDLGENINSRIDAAVENWRIEQSGVANLKDLMQEVKTHVRMKSYTVDEDGREKISESGVYMAVSMILGMIIYMFIAVFGSMVMSSVIEEKSSRVVEVLVSSVKATELMFGKIIGIALVALTQFVLWIVLTFAIVGIGGAFIGPRLAGEADAAQLMQAMGGVGAEQAEAVSEAVSDPDSLSVILGTVSNLPFGTIIVCFMIFFLFGYMLYASMFAAIGSAVENEGDSAQLQLPVTVPLLLAFFIAIYAFKAPGSSIVFWGSMIPFTSPIVMLARLPFGVPFWEIALSVVLLVAAFIVFAWLSARIYRVGILMFGKKSGWKNLWQWLKQK